jgi:drug/metabolite transporter (DMT)-like permease
MKLPVVVLFGASVLWGLTWWPLKALHAAGFEGLSLVCACFGLLALTLSPVLWRQRAQWRERKGKLLLIALLGGAANLTFAYAMIVGDVVRVMVLFYLLPIWGVLGGRFILKEYVDAWRWAGVALAIAGAFIVLGGFAVWQQPPTWIDGIAVLSGLCFAFNNLVFRAVQEVPVASKMSALCYGCFVLAALSLLLSAESFNGGDSLNAWLGLAAYALIWMLAANYGSQWAVTQLEVGRSSIIIIMELITAVVSAALILGKVLTPAEMLGGALILAAALIEALRSSPDGNPGK